MSSESRIARLRAVALLASGMLLALPACAGLFDDEEARRQILQQQKRTEDLRAQIDMIAGRVAKVEETLRNPPAQPVQPVLDLANQMESLREEVKSLRGQIEVLNHNIDSAAKRQRDMYVDLDTRLRRLEQAAAAAPAVTPPAVTPGAAAPAPAAPGAAGPALASPTPEETRAYEAAQQQRRIGNYQGAITAFQAFVAQHPKSALAPRAQYWIGDSYFNLRDFKNAITSQQKLIATYADSTSVPDALLNIASSQLEQGDVAAARKTMDGIVTRYPNSEAAEKAKRRLATLK